MELIDRIIGAEAVVGVADDQLSPEDLETLRGAKNPAIVEVAGRDSIAAAVKAVSDRNFDLLLTTVAYTATEFGRWITMEDRVRFLRARLGETGREVEVLGPIYMGSPRFWRALCGRHITSLFERFGFYTPCLGCHLYLHSVRIPLARSTGVNLVVSGERESHDGQVKLNQVSDALDAYRNFLAGFDVELYLPLRHISDGSAIAELVGDTWSEDEEGIDCVLSGNYLSPTGELSYDEDAVKRFFSEFALPLAKSVVNAWLSGKTPDYQKLAGELLID